MCYSLVKRIKISDTIYVCVFTIRTCLLGNINLQRNLPHENIRIYLQLSCKRQKKYKIIVGKYYKHMYFQLNWLYVYALFFTKWKEKLRPSACPLICVLHLRAINHKDKFYTGTVLQMLSVKFYFYSIGSIKQFTPHLSGLSTQRVHLNSTLDFRDIRKNYRFHKSYVLSFQLRDTTRVTCFCHLCIHVHIYTSCARHDNNEGKKEEQAKNRLHDRRQSERMTQ